MNTSQTLAASEHIPQSNDGPCLFNVLVWTLPAACVVSVILTAVAVTYWKTREKAPYLGYRQSTVSRLNPMHGSRVDYTMEIDKLVSLFSDLKETVYYANTTPHDHLSLGSAVTGFQSSLQNRLEQIATIENELTRVTENMRENLKPKSRV